MLTVSFQQMYDILPEDANFLRKKHYFTVSTTLRYKSVAMLPVNG